MRDIKIDKRERERERERKKERERIKLDIFSYQNRFILYARDAKLGIAFVLFFLCHNE